MDEAFVDTDVIIRLLTGDDPAKQAAAATLFQQVERGDVQLRAPVTVVADALYVLASKRLYAVPRAETSEMLSALVRLPGFHVSDRRTVLRALELYGANPVDFGDALLVASMEHEGATVIYTYDGDFGRFPNVRGLQPGALSGDGG